MFQFLVSWPGDDPSVGLKLDAIQTQIFTSELFVIVNIYRYCILYTNEDVSYKKLCYYECTMY
jgi:hypothetical protein